MGENPMTPNSPTSQGNQSETVAASGVEHSAEAKGNRPAMTDEERARDFLSRFLEYGSPDKPRTQVMDLISAIRADQREKDAGIADRQRRDLPTPQTSPEAAGTYAFNNGCSSAAAAIRARGGQP